MSAELIGARRDAELVEAVSFPRSKEQMLAKSLLLIIQHLEKVENQ